jgi:hypothetical protein
MYDEEKLRELVDAHVKTAALAACLHFAGDYTNVPAVEAEGAVSEGAAAFAAFDAYLKTGEPGSF